MEKKLVVKRLKDTLKKLKELEKAKFSYHRFVESYDGFCGTVCCVAGWYPKWFPESNLTWRKFHSSFMPGFVDLEFLEGQICEALTIHHGISHELVQVLFYGDTDSFPVGTAEKKKYSKRTIGLINGEDSSKKEVEELWAHVIELIETDKIIYN